MIRCFPKNVLSPCGSKASFVLRYSCAGHADVVDVLLSKFEGIEVDARNRLGITPLIKACVTGKRKCVQILLDKGGLVYVLPI